MAIREYTKNQQERMKRTAEGERFFNEHQAKINKIKSNVTSPFRKAKSLLQKGKRILTDTGYMFKK